MARVAASAAAARTTTTGRSNVDTQEDEHEPSQRHPSPDLRADAPAFVPQERLQEFKLPPRVKTVRPKKDMYHVFDAVPFTPSQGVKTPSPNNMAALRWQMFSPFATPGHYHPDSPTTVLRNNFAPSDSSSNSDTSATQVMSPVHPAGSMSYSPLMFYPIAINPGLPGFPTPDMPHSPHGPSSPLLPGSPVGTPPGMRPASYPFMPIHLATPPPGSTFASPMDLHGRRGSSVPAHHMMAPHRLSRTHLYSPNGVFPHGHVAHGHVAVPAGMGYPPPMHPSPTSYLRRARPPTRSVDAPESSDGGYSSESKSKFKPRKNNSEPKVGADGMPRLNARQRRTLRRAKERALKALMETGSKLLQKAGLGDLQLADLAGSPEDGALADSVGGEGLSSSPADKPRQLSPEQCEANRAEAAAAVSQALAECSVEPTKSPVNLDRNNIAELIQQLSLKQDEGIVDEKLIRDLQIIQGLLGALKQTPVPGKQGTPQKPHRSPGPRAYERPAIGHGKPQAMAMMSP